MAHPLLILIMEKINFNVEHCGEWIMKLGTKIVLITTTTFMSLSAMGSAPADVGFKSGQLLAEQVVPMIQSSVTLNQSGNVLHYSYERLNRTSKCKYD